MRLPISLKFFFFFFFFALFRSFTFSKIIDPRVKSTFTTPLTQQPHTTMVKLTQVEDEFQTNYSDGTTTVEKVEVDTFADSDSEFEDEYDDEDDDFDIANETIYDRIVALKDIISQQHRDQLCNISSTLNSFVSLGLNNGGKLLWTLTSSSLLLGVPLALAILSETQLQEMESNISLQQSAQDVLAPGSEEAFGKKKELA